MDTVVEMLNRLDARVSEINARLKSQEPVFRAIDGSIRRLEESILPVANSCAATAACVELLAEAATGGDVNVVEIGSACGS